jgi:hypothetical protein
MRRLDSPVSVVLALRDEPQARVDRVLAAVPTQMGHGAIEVVAAGDCCVRSSATVDGDQTSPSALIQASQSAFADFRFPPDVIVLAFRWYLRCGLSYQDVEELLAERGIEVDHVTIYR